MPSIALGVIRITLSDVTPEFVQFLTDRPGLYTKFKYAFY